MVSMFFVGVKVYQQEMDIAKKEWEVHPLCKDTKARTAWVARKNGEVRCFLEQDEYPHRAKGSYLDYTEDVPVGGS